MHGLIFDKLVYELHYCHKHKVLFFVIDINYFALHFDLRVSETSSLGYSLMSKGYFRQALSPSQKQQHY